MNKISRQAAVALMEGKTFESKNTTVGSGEMWFFGKRIAMKCEGHYTLCLKGMSNKTVVERLNSLCLIARLGGGFHFEGGVPYWNGRPTNLQCVIFLPIPPE